MTLNDDSMAVVGLINPSELSTRTINARANEYEFKTITRAQVEEYLNNGWEVYPSKLKHFVRIHKKKTHFDAFEDRIWALFARMKFSVLNEGKLYKLEYAKGLRKQIDIFAADTESIIMVECKSSRVRKRVTFQKEINELIGLKGKLTFAAKSIFPGSPKVAIIFATHNSIVSDSDRLRLEEGGIFHFNQDDIEYFEQLTSLLGYAAKYQLFGKLFQGKEIPELKNRVPAIRGKVPGGFYFYSFCIEPEYLLKIGYVLHRTATNKDSTNAYQRLIQKDRLKKIGDYINNKGFFPNSIIVNIQSKKGQPLEFSHGAKMEHDSECTTMGILHLPKLYKSAFIIDGQHRLYGYSVADSESHHTIPVVAFENLSEELQTKIFVDINHTQKTVPANLLHSIMADFNWDSQYDDVAISALKTRLFAELNSDDSSPFYKRIIITQEKKTDLRCLTLQTLRSWGLNKVNFFGQLKGKDLITSGYLSDITYDKTLKKSKEFFNICFVKIETNLENQWNLGAADGGFIGMNIGVSAIFRVIDSILEYLVRIKGVKPELLNGKELGEIVCVYLEPVIKFVDKLDIDGIKRLRSMFGSGATEKVLLELQAAINEDYKDFNPDGLEQWIKESSGKFTTLSYILGNEKLQPLLDNFIKARLVKEFGERNWWYEGIPEKVRTACVMRKEQEKSQNDPWAFLDTIHYKEIVDQNWILFEEYLTPPGFKKNDGKEKKLGWIRNFNDVRKKYSHPQREKVTEAEYTFLQETFTWLASNLSKQSFVVPK